MKLSETVKPISYIKAHASEIVRDVSQNRGTVIVTLNGEAKAVIQDIREFEKNQESLAMLKILALGRKSFQEGKTKPAYEVFRSLREKTRNAGEDEF